MDWKSHRIDALLEQALVEDRLSAMPRPTSPSIPNLRASASILARQEMVVAGLGAVPRFLEIFARLDPRPAGAHTLRSRQPPGDLRRRARARGARCWP